VFDAIQSLVEIINTAASGFADICQGTGSGSIWANWDCIFQKLLGMSNNALFLGIGGFLTSFFFSSSIGSTVFFAGVYILITILSIAMRIVFTYLVAFFAIAFLFLLAPLFVPLIFFGRTYQKFAVYFKMILSYALQPPLLVLFVVMLLTALEFAIFVGPTSLYGVFSNTNPPTAVSFHDAMYLNGGGGTINNVIQAVTGYTEDLSENVAVTAQAVSGKMQTNAGNLTMESAYADAVVIAEGTKGVLNNALSSAQALDDAGTVPFSLDVPSLDVDQLVSAINGRVGAVTTLTKEDWFQNIALQMAATCILVFILFQMIRTVPQMSQDLVSKNFRKMGGVSQIQMVGEQEVRSAIGTARDAAKRGQQTQDPETATRTTLTEAYEAAAGIRKDVGGKS